jgi:hypothetical protein
MSGLDDFKSLLDEFGKMSAWAAGGSVALPFIASFISIIPPWPASLNVMTAIFQLLALILVFQAYKRTPRAKVTRNIALLFAACFLIIVVYVVLFSLFTIHVPQASRSIVVGYECLANAKRVYGADCPFLNLDQLASASYDEFLLWTKPSIAVMRAIFIVLWFLFFICLAALIGKFLVYQMRAPGRAKAPGKA